VSTLLHATIYVFVHNLLNVLIQIANKVGLQKLSLPARSEVRQVSQKPMIWPIRHDYVTACVATDSSVRLTRAQRKCLFRSSICSRSYQTSLHRSDGWFWPVDLCCAAVSQSASQDWWACAVTIFCLSKNYVEVIESLLLVHCVLLPRAVCLFLSLSLSLSLCRRLHTLTLMCWQRRKLSARLYLKKAVLETSRYMRINWHHTWSTPKTSALGPIMKHAPFLVVRSHAWWVQYRLSLTCPP
jgi:hypothetical protein